MHMVACARRLQDKLRMFRLLSLQDEYAYLLAADYRSVIDRLLAEQQASELCCAPSVRTISAVTMPCVLLGCMHGWGWLCPQPMSEGLAVKGT
jgi:hypothetical protein